MNRATLVTLCLTFFLPLFVEAEEPEKADPRPIVIGKLSWMTKHNQEKAAKALAKLPSVTEAKADYKTNMVELTLEPGTTVALSQVGPALKGTGVTVKSSSLLLQGECTVKLRGEMRGVRRRRTREFSRADDLRAAMVALPQVAELRWVGLDRFVLTLSRPLALKTLVALLARHGSTENGSGLIADVLWAGPSRKQAKAEERRERKRQRREKAEKAKEPGGEAEEKLK